MLPRLALHEGFAILGALSQLGLAGVAVDAVVCERARELAVHAPRESA